MAVTGCRGAALLDATGARGAVKEVESSNPKFESRLSKGECKLDLVWPGALRLLVLADGGGGRGGGNGGGKTDCCGFELKALSKARMLASSSSSPSLALGISERNSKSSVESASELLGLEAPRELRFREKRLRNRETADGGG